MSEQKPLTISVPEAGRRYFDLSRNAAYAAAERGEIPTVRIGKLLRVPVRAWRRCWTGEQKTRGMNARIAGPAIEAACAFPVTWASQSR